MTLLRRIGNAASAIPSGLVAVLARQTGDGWRFLILAGLCGLLSIGSNPWSNIPLLLCLMLISLWLLAMWRGTRAVRGIQIRRSCPERVFANENLSVNLYLSNTFAWPCAGLVVSEQVESDDALDVAPKPGDTAPRPAPRASVAYVGGSFVTIVPGNSLERVKYNLVVRRRGIYKFGESRIETDFPLGFFKSHATRSVPGRLVVYPRLGEMDSAFFKDLDVALEYIRRWKPSRAEEDFRGLREYRQGDNPKWIHWKSTARVQKVLVKEFEEPQARRVLLVLDTNLQRMGVQRFPAFETAISFVGTVARDLVRRGCEVECVALQPRDRVVRITVSRERRNLDMLLELLAGMKRDDKRTLGSLVDVLGRRSLRRAFVLVLGLGSIRARTPMAWLNTGDNAVKIVDVRSDEFKRVFKRTSGGAARDDGADDDLFGLGEEEIEEEVAAVAP
jgi:uncharacterized protein (DUF58 family)